MVYRKSDEKTSVPNRLSTTSLVTDGLMRSHSHESNLQYTVNNNRESGLTRYIGIFMYQTQKPLLILVV